MRCEFMFPFKHNEYEAIVPKVPHERPTEGTFTPAKPIDNFSHMNRPRVQVACMGQSAQSNLAFHGSVSGDNNAVTDFVIKRPACNQGMAINMTAMLMFGPT